MKLHLRQPKPHPWRSARIFAVASLPCAPPRAPPMAVPITERANPLSMAIDVASPPEILAILNSIDLQIFNGWSEVHPRLHALPGRLRPHPLRQGAHTFPALPAMETVMQMIVDRLTPLMRHDEAATVVLSGCGTSGRIAWMCARRMNALLRAAGKRPICRYLIASGDSALLIGQEQGEDDPHRAETDIAAVVSAYALCTAALHERR